MGRELGKGCGSMLQRSIVFCWPRHILRFHVSKFCWSKFTANIKKMPLCGREDLEAKAGSK